MTVKIEDFESNLDDKDTWDLLCSGRTKGIFQLEKQGRVAARVKPRNIAELSDLLSIIRPGCVSGTTKILVKLKNNRQRFAFRSLEYLARRPPKTIVSYDETTKSFIENEVLRIFPTGQKEVFLVNTRKEISTRKGRERLGRFLNLECTADHKLLRSDGEWVELKDLNPGDRLAVRKIAVRSHQRNKVIKTRRATGKTYVENLEHFRHFREICYKYYKEKCVICGWNECTLDVHHIDGNRYTDNSPGNLCFLCPNCHRKHHSGVISREELIEARNACVLPLSDDIEWATYTGKESLGFKDTYDISMSAEPHNFIAGGFVVHNCKDSILDGKSLTNHYIDRKNGAEEVTYIHPALEPILKSSQGILVMQEEILRIAIDIAGFTPEEADTVRKNVGKKDQKGIKEGRVKFIDGAAKKGVVPPDIAGQIYDWIESAGRYGFNRSILGSTVVKTVDGESTIDNLCIGDQILAPSSGNQTCDEYCTVIDKYDHGKLDVFEITMEDGKNITCTLGHKFLCSNGGIYPLYHILANDLEIMCYG